jgi:hypothetical protein
MNIGIGYQDDDTLVLAQAAQRVMKMAHDPLAEAGIVERPWEEPVTPVDHLLLLRDTLDLVKDLWPSPAAATVTLETHQWVKLRRVLLAIPDLLAEAEK